MSRGVLTDELAEKYGITLKELRLIPYFQYLLINHQAVDIRKIDQEERDILQRWRDEGKITFSCYYPVRASREFWDFMNDVLWDSYVPHIDDEEEVLDIYAEKVLPK
jgi:hypothetical protein